MKAILALLLLSCVSLSAYAQEVKNVTTVIPGKLARSGSSNRSAYSDATLKSLCEQGYTLAVYVYAGAKPHDVTCSRGKISYLSMTNWEKPATILARIDEQLKNGGKVMVHCWYGVHASNYVTSLALNRQCGFSAAQASAIFRKGVPPKSLPGPRINQLAGEIEQLSVGGGRVMEGCPAAQ